MAGSGGTCIDVVWGEGNGRTELGAFDAALADAGLQNYNLVRLSSVLPPDATVVEAGRVERTLPVGTPLGVVLADCASSDPGTTVAAGLGWAVAEDGGIFMEATGDSMDGCRDAVEASLADARALRDWDWEHECETVVRSHVVEGASNPSPSRSSSSDAVAGAVVVAAVYGPLTHRWSGG